MLAIPADRRDNGAANRKSGGCRDHFGTPFEKMG
jgi:hypothetical protein